MPLVRALPLRDRDYARLAGPSPNQGRSPLEQSHLTSRQSRRLTSGGKADATPAHIGLWRCASGGQVVTTSRSETKRSRTERTMPMFHRIVILCLAMCVTAGLVQTAGQSIVRESAPLPPRQLENLGRGVVAVQHAPGKVFIGWRLLGTDPESIAFNVYRSIPGAKPVKLNPTPLSSATSFIDEQADLTKVNSYFVRPVLNRGEQTASAPFVLSANPPVQQYISIPLQTPEGYTPNDASVGDLDGDGEYEIVLHQAGRGRDNSQAGLTTEPILEAYKLDGRFLWRINLGRNIREGAHYTQFMVYDFDGDGRAEVACKTADGTIDGKGKVIGDAKADYRAPEGSTVTTKNRAGVEQTRNVSGFVLAGPEYLTIFDGQTGAALATTDFVPPRHPTSLKPTVDEMSAIWGDGVGNRVDRFLAGVAYLDGERPSLIMARGYYTRAVLTAWNWKGMENSVDFGLLIAMPDQKQIESIEGREIIN